MDTEETFHLRQIPGGIAMRLLLLIWGAFACAMAWTPGSLYAQPAPVVSSTEFEREANTTFETPDPIGELASLASFTVAGAAPSVERETLFDNLSLFGGLDGSKQPQDFGINAHFGGRIHANWGIPLVRDLGIGLQLGAGYNFSDNAVQVVERVLGPTNRQQYFQTVGLFQSTEFVRWGVAYDFLNQSYYDQFNLGQWRGKLEVILTEKDDVGVWVAFEGQDDQGFFGGTEVTLRPISQGNIFWTHIWEHQARTTIWAGMSEGHSQANAALGDLPRTHDCFVFGSELHIPLNDRVALYGQANFIRPADTGTVDATLGLVYYPGTSAYRARQQRFAPLFAVGNNPTFAQDLFR